MAYVLHVLTSRASGYYGNHNYFSLMTTKCNNINSQSLCIDVNICTYSYICAYFCCIVFTLYMLAYVYEHMPFHLFKTYFICIILRYHKRIKCKAWILLLHKPNKLSFVYNFFHFCFCFVFKTNSS